MENGHDLSRQLAESQAYLEHFIRAYSSAYTVDLANDSFEILHMDHAFQQVFTMNGTRKDMERFIQEHVHPDDRAKVSQLSDRNYLRERLKTEAEISFTIREQYDGSERTMKAVILRGADADHAAVGFMDVTEEVAQERAAAKAMEDYRKAMLAHALIAFTANLTTDTLTSGFWIDDEGREVSLREILGMEMPCSYDTYIDLWNEKFVSESSRARFAGYTDRQALLDAFHEGRSEITFDYRANTISGSAQYLRRIITLARNEATGDIIAYTNVKDVTAEKRQEMELITQTNVINRLAVRYADVYLVNAVTGLIRPLRVSGNAVGVEQAIGNQMPYDKAMAVYIANNVDEPDRAEMREVTALERLLPALHRHEFVYHHYRARSTAKKTNYYCMTAASLGDREKFTQFVVGFSCETEEKEKELALESALQMAQSANRAKTTFLNNMSHDIRTPMNAIIGYTGLAMSHIDNAELVQSYLTKIQQSSEHLLSLINDVLDMSRIESGKMSLNEKPENLSEILHSLRNIIHADVCSKELEFHMDSEDVRNENVICDRLRLDQVLLNVLSNAIKYTPARGSISLRLRQLDGGRAGKGRYEIRVADTGMGMSPEFLKTIFDPFTRVNSSTVSGIQGTGLGMAITKNIVDMMGGDIEITSREGEGTAVLLRFEFPLAEEHPGQKLAQVQGLRAMVVDGDAHACRAAAKMLRDAGLRPEWYTSGHEAATAAGEALGSGDPFALVLLDWSMPGQGGGETARKLRDAAGDLPIVVLTAYDWSDMEEEAEDAGITGFLSKPLFPSDLQRILQRLFAPEEQKSETSEYDFTGKKLLLVEDNEMNREIACELLEEAGFVVDVATDGVYAVEKLEQTEPGQYDLVLMDVQMPMMDGYEATRHIRAMGGFRAELPIIAMTANAFEEDRQLAFEAGMNEHIAKPINVPKLKETLAKFMGIQE